MNYCDRIKSLTGVAGYVRWGRTALLRGPHLWITGYARQGFLWDVMEVVQILVDHSKWYDLPGTEMK